MEADPALAQPQAKPKLTLAQKLRGLSWKEWAFALGLVLYLGTRLIQLDKFPIYFFTDEAVQTMSAVDLLARGLRDVSGRLLPVYFENGGQYNLSLSVYLQLIPALLPRSVFLTRAVQAVISLAVPLTIWQPCRLGFCTPAPLLRPA
ncbi:MAG: putative membrane protein [Anaerolineae bacterium 49_20]|nr:MAG: putative membrane protein [Anaerolineae bacterium 49_20]